MQLVISKRRVVMLLLILPFFEPVCISFFESMNYLEIFFSISRVLVTCYVIGQYYFNRKRYKMPIKLFMLYEVGIILVNFINKTIYFGFVVSCFTSLGFFMLNYYLFSESPVDYFKSYVKLMGLFLVINFVCQITYPNGFILDRVGDNRIWFLGTKNGVTTYAMIFLVSYFSYYLLQYGKIKKKLLLSIMIIIIAYGDSMTMIIGIVVFFILLLCLKCLKVSKRDFKIIVLLFSICVAIIFFSDLRNVIINFVTSVTGKDITFSGRVEIWKQAFQFFISSPWIGQGIGLSFSPWTNGVVVYSAHSVYLELLSKYGIIVGSMYILMIGKGWIGLIKNKNRINNIGISFVTVFILISGFEAYDDYMRTFVIAYTGYILMLCNNKDLFLPNKKIERRN